MPIGTLLTPTQAVVGTAYTSFSQTFTITSSGLYEETISSVTVTKTPTSLPGTGTSYAYISLTLKDSNGSPINFINTDSITFNYSNVTEVNLTLSGIYSDSMFPQTIGYIDNPNKIPQTGNISSSIPKVSIKNKINNFSGYIANPKTNSYVTKNINYSTKTSTDNTANFKFTANSWASVPSVVDSVYSFIPPSFNTYDNYFTYTFNVVGTGVSFGNYTIPLVATQSVNYNLDYARQQLTNRLSSQRTNNR